KFNHKEFLALFCARAWRLREGMAQAAAPGFASPRSFNDLAASLDVPLMIVAAAPDPMPIAHRANRQSNQVNQLKSELVDSHPLYQDSIASFQTDTPTHPDALPYDSYTARSFTLYKECVSCVSSASVRVDTRIFRPCLRVCPEPIEVSSEPPRSCAGPPSQ